MTKTVNRALSMLLAVLMLVSMVSVFCLPTYAAADENTDGAASVSLDIDSASVSKIDEAHLDYEALRKDEDAADNYRTFIINSAWTSLKEGAELSYYFRGETYTETYNATRHFGSFSKAYEAYTKELNASNFLDYIPVFIFAPGTYDDVVLVHGNGIVLGSNAGINPNDTTVGWDYTNMQSGWAANTKWQNESGKVTVFSNRIDNGTRDSGQLQNGPYQSYLEAAKKANGNKAELEFVVDGVKLSGFDGFYGSYFDSSGGATAGTVADKHLQNSLCDDTPNEMFRSWDVSSTIASWYVTDSRFEKVDATNLFAKYLESAYVTGCSFNNVTGVLTSISDGTSDRGAFSINGAYRNRTGTTSNIVFEHNVVTNVDSEKVFAFGAKDGGFTINLQFTDNIVYNTVYPFIRPQDGASSVTTVVIEGNQFCNPAETEVAGAVYLDDMKGKTLALGFKNNKVIGGYTAMLTSDITDSHASKLSLDVCNNYWADVEGDEGKAHYLSNGVNFSVTSGFANDFDLIKAPYYLDSEMSVKNTDVDVAEVNGFDYYLLKEDGFTLVLDSKGKETAEVTKDTFKIDSDTAVITVIDADENEVTTPITAHTEGSYSLKVVMGSYTRTYAIEFDSNINDINKIISEARANGTTVLNGLDADNTFIYVDGVYDGDTAKISYNGTTYYATVESSGRPAVVSDTSVLKTVYDEDIESSNVASPEYNIILPTGETSGINITVPGTYYGTNAGIDPVDKAKENTTDEWTLSADWGVTGESGVGNITIAKDVEGTVTLDGITMRNRFVDSERVAASGKLTVNVINTVVDHTEALSVAQAIFDLENARTKNTASKFGAAYADEFNLSNLYVKQIKNATRVLSDSVPATVVIDNIYVDYAAARTGNNAFQPVLSNFKSGEGNVNGNYTVKNSMFRDHDSLNENHSALGLIGFCPQGDGTDYNVTVTNNVFYDATVTGAVISLDTNRVNSVNISDNLFIDNEKDSKGIVTVNYVDEDGDGIDDSAATKLDKFVIDSNSFLGYYSDAATFDVRLGKIYTNVFVSTEVDFTGLVGVQHAYGDEDYWLDYAREWKFSQLSILGITGLGEEANVSIDQSSGKISFVLDEGEFDIGMFDRPVGTTIAIKDKNGDKVYSIEVGADDLDAELIYTVELSKSGTTRSYELTVYNYPITDFTAAMEGEEIADFWLIDPSVKGIAAGQGVAAGWAGNRYRFYTGVNIFDSVDTAILYAKETNVTPKLLITEWDGDLEISSPVTIYAPNYDTAPHIVGSADDGSDWKANTEYEANQVYVDDIVITEDAYGDIVISGVTMNGTYVDKKRTAAANVTLKNILVDAPSAGTEFFEIANTSTKSETNTDKLIIQNMYFKAVKAKTVLIKTGSYLPSEFTMDNVYINAGNGFSGASPITLKVHQTGATPCFTVKNSNIRNMYAAYNNAARRIMTFYGNNDADVTGTQKIVFDGNILYNFATYQKKGAYSILDWRANAYSHLTFTNNNVIYNASEMNKAEDSATFILSDGLGTGNRNNEFYDTVTVTGNRFIGVDFTDGFAIKDGSYYAKYTIDIHDNFTLTSYDEKYYEVTEDGEDIPVTATIPKNNRTQNVSYYLDYAMKIGTGRIIDYKLAPVDEYTTVYQDENKVYYYLDPDRDETAKVQIVENADGSADYSIDMTTLFEEYSDLNTYEIKHGNETADVNDEVLTFTLSAEDYATAKDQLYIDIVITAIDGVTTETVTLELSKYPDAFIPAVKVTHPTESAETGTLVYEVAETDDAAVTENGDGTLTVDLSKLVNENFVEDATYGDNTAVTQTFTAEEYPVIVDVTVSGNPYKMYITDEFNEPVINSATINGTAVAPNRSNNILFTGDASLVGGHGSDPVSFDVPKYITVVIKDGDTVVEGINVPNDSEKTYTAVATDLIGNTKEYTLKIAVKKSIGELQALISEANKMTVNTDIYSAASVDAYKAVLAEAKTVNISQNTQDEINAAYTDLTNAINSLVDITALRTAIDAGNAADTEGCCTNSITALNNAIAAAEKTAEEALTASQVTAAADAVYTAVSGLTKHSFKTYTYNNDATCGSDGTESAKCVNGCDVTDTRTKAGTKLGHSFTKVTYNNDATCSADGTETVACANGCGTAYTRTKANSKVAHKYTNYVLDEGGKTKTAVCDYGCGTKNTVNVNADTENGGNTSTSIDACKIFTDVTHGSWYEEYVNYVYGAGIMNGTSDAKFEPNTAMTRAMTVTIIARMAGVDTDALKNSTTKFTDVESGKWYTGAVAWAVEAGITTGTSDTTFSPTDNVTREDICVLLVRSANYAKVTLKTDVAKASFPDDAKIGSWAKDAVYACQQAGIVNGTSDGTFDPKGTATRSAVAKIVTIFYRDYLAK